MDGRFRLLIDNGEGSGIIAHGPHIIPGLKAGITDVSE